MQKLEALEIFQNLLQQNSASFTTRTIEAVRIAIEVLERHVNYPGDDKIVEVMRANQDHLTVGRKLFFMGVKAAIDYENSLQSK